VVRVLLAEGGQRCEKEDLHSRPLPSPPQAYAASTPRLTPASAARLSLATTLTGHEGCVNRLAWDEGGQWLGSVSDDRCLIIRPLAACVGDEEVEGEQGGTVRLATSHFSNIFGVAFLPAPSCALPRQAVTGAMDGTVQLHDLSGWGGGGHGGGDGGQGGRPPPPPPAAASLRRRRGGGGGPAPARPRPIPTLHGATLAVLPCHTGRVKQVAVAPGEPHLFFSAAEDGTARLFDGRDPALMPRGTGPGGQRRSAGAANVFAAPTAGGAATVARGGGVPLKSLALCPSRPWLVALAGDDPFLRVYDRRLAGPASMAGARARAPLLSLAPPHLLIRPAPHSDRPGAGAAAHATFVDWSPTGLELLGNYSGDGVYRFDCGGGLLGGGGGAASNPLVPPPGWPPALPARRRQAAVAAAAPPGLWVPPTRVSAANALRPPLPPWATSASGGLGALPPAARAAARRPGGMGDGVAPLGDPEHAFPHPAAAQPWVDDVDCVTAALVAAPGAPFLLHRRSRALSFRLWAGDAWESLLDAIAALAADPASTDAMADAQTALSFLDVGVGAGETHDFDWDWEGSSSGGREGGGGGGVGGSSGGGARARPAPPQAWPGGVLPSARYLGALNLATDIKEARFFGDTIVAGSDDGLAVLWPAGRPGAGASAALPVPLCAALEADDDICNCVLPHPFLPLLATSGLEDVVRVWGLGGGGEGDDDGGGDPCARRPPRAAGAALPALRGVVSAPAELAAILATNATLSGPNGGSGIFGFPPPRPRPRGGWPAQGPPAVPAGLPLPLADAMRRHGLPSIPAGLPNELQAALRANPLLMMQFLDVASNGPG